MTTDEHLSDKAIVLHPIGVVRCDANQAPSRNDQPGASGEAGARELREVRRSIKERVSELEIDPRYEPMLDGIEGFSHIQVLYWPHLLEEGGRKLEKVHPRRRADIPKQGIFATRSPARPNPLLLSTVRLLGRDGARLRVQGLDAVDGSPILDIKPYNRELVEAENPSYPDWMELLMKELREER
jgi:tRNA-Thr(GGU) m(6)t(6)A37 methyltransferase TsaA